ncbi:MAG: hypothetical protein IJM81_01435 [Prevotella sp.]|nr:hypothetical protein [Prevotella sp.]MBQ6652047.1 hypothetical protein [Prevotella sp.]
MTDYDDIINLPHHTSDHHPRMAMIDRAAQFAPFAAVVGYDDAIAETGRYTDSRPVAGDDKLNELDRKMAAIVKTIESHPEVEITFFVADERKDGGSYQTLTAQVVKVDETERRLYLSEGTAIYIRDIIRLINK